MGGGGTGKCGVNMTGGADLGGGVALPAVGHIVAAGMADGAILDILGIGDKVVTMPFIISSYAISICVNPDPIGKSIHRDCCVDHVDPAAQVNIFGCHFFAVQRAVAGNADSGIEMQAGMGRLVHIFAVAALAAVDGGQHALGIQLHGHCPVSRDIKVIDCSTSVVGGCVQRSKSDSQPLVVSGTGVGNSHQSPRQQNPGLRPVS